MSIAERTALLSRAIRLKVGAVLVKDGRIISQSWNGTPAGHDNTCEVKEWMPEGCLHLDHEYPYTEHSSRYRLKTKPTVIHAEENLVMKLASSSESGKDATIFITHSPCINCAKLIYGAGISTVYFKDNYRDTAGIEFLKSVGIEVNQYQQESL